MASLALATLMLASPLQVFAESGTGTGGSPNTPEYKTLKRILSLMEHYHDWRCSIFI